MLNPNPALECKKCARALELPGLLSLLLGLSLTVSQPEAQAIEGEASSRPIEVADWKATRADFEPHRRQALFGDVHVHSDRSFDAYIFGTRMSVDDAYRFAMGEKIRHQNGYELQLKGGALDFYAVTDHAEYLGVVPLMSDSAFALSKTPEAEGIFSGVRSERAAVFGDVFKSIADSKPITGISNKEVAISTWLENQSAADRYYAPGEFTTFAGYEYTAQPGYANLHRIVLFKGARRPDELFGAFESPNPEDLWDWMDGLRSKGIDTLAIPHNSNVSDGRMFERSDFNGQPLDSDYAEQRMRNEPIVEISQIKGTSETHPALSPNDEFAGFEIYSALLGPNTPTKVDGGYARQALGRGLELDETEGFNPFQFGMVGSSDTHNAAAPVDEEHYIGKYGQLDGSVLGRRAVYDEAEAAAAAKVNMPTVKAANHTKWGAAGLAGVWAKENTRQSIFAAFRRKETFATSGPRIAVRLFAGYDYPQDIFDRGDYTEIAYRDGVPMGQTLAARDDDAPVFLVSSLKDPFDAGIERMQIVKSWVEDGKARERVYDVACLNGRPDVTTGKCSAADVEVQVDTMECDSNFKNGAAQMNTRWIDPDFNASQRAVYYARVIQTPTCRWSTYDANISGRTLMPDIPKTLQERAWSSPIWFQPG